MGFPGDQMVMQEMHSSILQFNYTILILLQLKKKGGGEDGFKQVHWKSVVGEVIDSFHSLWPCVGTSAPDAVIMLPKCVCVEAWRFGSFIRMAVQCVNMLCFA